MINSMTAYARGSVEGEWGTLVLELRSVNHRFLDVSLRLPDVIREVEMQVREVIRDSIQRGKLECNVNYAPPAGQTTLSFDEGALNNLLQTMQSVGKNIKHAAPIDLLAVLSWPGVLQTNPVNIDEIKKQLMQLLDLVIIDFLAMRRREGEAITQMIEQRLTQLSAEIKAVTKRYPIHLKAQQDKVIRRIQEIESETEFAVGRIEQELVMLASKMDIAEEMDRLSAHIVEAKRLLTDGLSQGRRFNFLSQEMNREANTLGAKSQDTEISQRAIEMKVLIEQVREQVQNIE